MSATLAAPPASARQRSMCQHCVSTTGSILKHHLGALTHVRHGEAGVCRNVHEHAIKSGFCAAQEWVLCCATQQSCIATGHHDCKCRHLRVPAPGLRAPAPMHTLARSLLVAMKHHEPHRNGSKGGRTGHVEELGIGMDVPPPRNRWTHTNEDVGGLEVAVYERGARRLHGRHAARDAQRHLQPRPHRMLGVPQRLPAPAAHILCVLRSCCFRVEHMNQAVVSPSPEIRNTAPLLGDN